MVMTDRGRQWLFLTAALLALASVIGWNLYSERTTIDAGERERLTTQANVIDENIGRQLGAVYSALSSIRSDLPFLDPKRDDGIQLNRRLKAMSDTMPGVRTLIVFDKDGTIVACNRAEMIGQNFRERPYFQIAQQRNDPSVLHVSEPFNTTLGLFAINVVRVIPDASGRFAGVVSATLDPQYFRTLLGSVIYATDMWTALGHGDGKLFLMVPEREFLLGQNLSYKGSLFSSHIKSGQTTTVVTGLVSVTGDERMIVQRTVRPTSVFMDKPLVIAVSRDMAALFAPWRGDVHIQGGLFGVLVLVSSMGLYFYQRRQSNFARITAIQEAEQRRNVEQYQTIIRASLDGFWITDSSGRVLDTNDAICQMLGYSREELLRMSISEIEADESPAEIDMRISEMMETGHVHFEARHRRKDGTIIHVEVSVLYVPDLGERFFAFVRNITEHKQAEKALQNSKHQYDLMVSRIPVGIYLLHSMPDESFVLNYASPRMAEMLNVSVESLLQNSESVFLAIHPDDRQSFIDLNLEGIRQKQPFDWTGRFPIADTVKWLHFASAPETQEDGTMFWFGLVTDVSESKQMEDQVRQLAFNDPLTKLPNRRLLNDRLSQTIAANKRNNSYGSMLFLDLDNFKPLNDEFGHDIGDLLLIEVAERLKHCVREMDTVARFGGDEFVVILSELPADKAESVSQANIVAEKIRRRLSEPYLLTSNIEGETTDIKHHCTVSIGVAMFSNNESCMEDILKWADSAMYQAKEAGRNAVRFYEKV